MTSVIETKATAAEADDEGLPSTGERFIPGLGGSIELEHLHRYLFARQACAGKAVLDIACGEGYGSAMLAQSAASVVGVDIADEAIRHARKRYGAPNLRFEVGSCAAIPLDDATVDVVVSFETIEHHDEHEAMMREIRRVLKPGGLFVISSPERFEYSERPGTHNEFHVHELYRYEFVDLMQRYFTHVDLYDQKVLFGSAILSETLATETTSLHANALHERSRGLVRPVYLIAVASDGAIAPFDTGVFEQELAETSEWRWWIDTVGERDTRIRALSTTVDELQSTLAQQLARLEGAARDESRLAELQAALATTASQRDEALQRHQQAVAEIAALRGRVVETYDALAAQKAEHDAASATREKELDRVFEARRVEDALARATAERKLRDDAAMREEVLQREMSTRQQAWSQHAAERERALLQQAAERERVLSQQAAERERALSQQAAERERALSQQAAGRERDLLEEAASRNAAFESRTAHSEKALTHLRQRLADLSADLARFTQQYGAAVAWGESLDAELDRQRLEVVAAQARVAGLDADLQALHHYAAKLQWVLSTTQHALEVGEARAVAREGAIADLQTELAYQRAMRVAILASTSWRSTAPLRAAKSALQAGRRGMRRGGSHALHLLRRAYRLLPMSSGVRSHAKDAFFRMSAFALRDTAAYRDWVRFNEAREMHRTAPEPDEPGIDAAPVAAIGSMIVERELREVSAPSAEAPSAAEPIPQLAEQTTEMTEPSTLSPIYSATGMALWVADGTKEWADLPVLRERIAAVTSAHHASVVPPPIEMIDLADADLAAVAGSLAFAECATPIVTILVPAFNHVVLTLECLTSIARAKGAIPFEVLVADDASTDATADLLARIANIKVHRNRENLHFLRNCNAALPAAAGRYVVFLNNDVQVQDWWLDELVATFDRHERVGAVGPKIVYPSGHLQEAGCAWNVDMSVDMIGLNDDPSMPRYNYERRVDYCSGACLMVPTDLLRRLGGFSEAFAPAYCEDGDLCLRIREAAFYVYYTPLATVIHRMSATTSAKNVVDKPRLVAANLAVFAQKWQDRVESEAEVRTIAFYLPQFYPFPENDRWWGKGFTEWTNVTKAQPNFVGHYQPHLPADLGYYDLRVSQTMEAQAKLARRYGLGGFCFYYYWFAGKRLLDLPLERMLETGRPDFPFCLCWANENWTRRWDGQETHVLMAQSHSDADDEAVILDLMRYFRRPNYIRIDGRPLLVVYRVTLFPDFARTAAHWRQVCRDQGIGEIYISMVESFELVSAAFHPSTYGCDATIEFPPQGLAEAVAPSGPLINSDFVGHCVDYRTLAMRYSNRPSPAYTRFRGAMPGWDNTPRRQNNSYCIENASPGAFQAWLEHIVDDARRQHFGDERIVFINAWNEWAEGAHLEPDRRFGHTYLEALANAKDYRALLKRHRYAFDG